MRKMLSNWKKCAAAILLAVTVFICCPCAKGADVTSAGAPAAEAGSSSATPEAAPVTDAAATEVGDPQTDTEAENDPLVDRLAAAQRDIRTRKLGVYGMVPVYGRDVADGIYDIKVDSSSPFFKIIDSKLIVKEGEMQAQITISSMSYLYVYPGTARDAGDAPKSEWLSFVEDDHHTVFTLPIERLDGTVPCAAYSKKRAKWYDRDLVFYASSLPPEALAFPLPDQELIQAAIRTMELDGLEEALARQEEERFNGVPEAVSIPRDDGEYSIEVAMSGGSGRATVSSPTLLIVRDGKAYARLIWSSTYYDYMLVGGALFPNLTTDGGNSVFEIPITAMDEPMDVIGDTTAMGDALEIEYTLTFYSDSIGSKGSIPQEAAKKVLITAGAIIVFGGGLNYLVKHRRRKYT